MKVPNGRSRPNRREEVRLKSQPDRQAGRELARGRSRGVVRALCLRGAAILLGLLVAGVMAEAALRALGVEPLQLRGKLFLSEETHPARNFHCYTSNPHGEFRRLPDVNRGEWRLWNYLLPPQELPLSRLAGTPYCVEYELSAQGLRNPVIDSVPPAGRDRIVCVGDSFVFGEGVPDAGTLPRQLEARLGTRYEVDNLGKVGDDTSKEIERIQVARSLIACNRILLVFIANDISCPEQLAARQTYINDLINVRDEYLLQRDFGAWYRGRSRLLALVGSNLAMRQIGKETIQWYRDLYDPKQNEPGLTQLRDQFRRLAKLDSCQVALVLYPLMEGLESTYPLEPVHATVSRLAQEAGLPVCDLAPAFAGQKTAEMQVHPVDHHPNSKAHKIAAKAIETWLRRSQPGFLSSN